MPLETQQATITTVSVEVRALMIDDKPDDGQTLGRRIKA